MQNISPIICRVLWLLQGNLQSQFIHGRRVGYPAGQPKASSLRTVKRAVSQKGFQENPTQQGTKQHSHSALVSTIPSPAGLSHDSGSIVEGPQERSDLSVTNLKKFRLSYLYFQASPAPYPGQWPGSCQSILSSVSLDSLEPGKGRRTFPPWDMDLESHASAVGWIWTHFPPPSSAPFVPSARPPGSITQLGLSQSYPNGCSLLPPSLL